MRTQVNRKNRNAVQKKGRARRRSVLFIIGYMMAIAVLCFGLYSRMEPGEGSISQPQKTGLTNTINLEGLNSTYAILIDVETGQVLAEKNSHMRMYPASMTKLMAALVAVEHTENWDASIEISQQLISRLYLEHASLAGFEPEERVSPMDLLYGMLLPSGAECCTSYAIWLAGDEKTFVGWMNDRAAELGMKKTHFVNTSGLHDKKHYSTAADMAILLEQCLQNETLRSVISAKSYQTTPTAKHPQGINLQSTLFQALEEYPALSEMFADEMLSQVTILGGKTGYTSQAGLCLASFAQVGDREYLLVTAGAEGNHYTDPFHIEDALEMYGQLAQDLP